MESAGKRVVMKVIRPWRDRHSTRERLVVDHVHLKRLLCGECNVIPDGVENDVGDRIKLTIAVASLEEAPMVPRTQARSWDAGNCLEIEPMDSI